MAKALVLHEYKSRDSGNVTKSMQQYLFVSKTRSQRNSGIHVLYQMRDFSIRLAAKIYLISETKAEPDLSFVWDELVRYK